MTTVIPDNAHVVLPPHGFVALDGALATDIDVVNAARISLAARGKPMYECSDGKVFGTHKEALAHAVLTMHAGYNTSRNPEENIVESLSPKDAGLLGFLMREKHGSPFSHNYFRFHIRAPMFVKVQWQTHTVGTALNAESGRYSEIEEDFYVPEAVRTQKGKPGAYTFENLEDPEGLITQYFQQSYDDSYMHYKALLHNGVSKEQARMVLPQGIYQQFIWSFNARSLMKFIELRNDEHAQWEIRQYAKAVEDEFKKAMPLTHSAFEANGRIAP